MDRSRVVAAATRPSPADARRAAVTRYEVRDASGLLVAVHCREDGPDGKRIWWELPDGTRGLGGMSSAALPLYGIDRLDGLSPMVVIVEGEKAAEALWGVGIAAVGTVTGASGTPGASALADLTGMRAHLWPDNDGVGRSHMERNATGLSRIAVDLRLIEWPGAPEHGDAADFVAMGGAREDVEELLAGALPLPAVSVTSPSRDGSQAWEPPLSLDRRIDLPAFPVAGLPDWLSSFVLAEAEATQTPSDMAAMFVLAALATVTAGRAWVEPVAGWSEGLNLFIAVAMEPGSRKSAVHRDVIGPIVDHERLLVQLAQPDIAEQASIRRIAEASLAKTEKAAAAATDRIERLALEDEARTLASALDRLDVAVAPRLFTADVTPEKLASLLHENQGRISVLSAEGGIFDIMAGRYSSKVPNIDVYLAGHAGDPIRVDRRGRPPELVDRPALTIGLAVQPYVLAKAARVGDFAGRGLLDRFLYAIPTGTVGYRATGTPPVPEATRRQYDTSLRALAASFDRFAEPTTLHFGQEASAMFTTWRAAIEPRRRPDADLGHIAGWSSKLDGAVARIAGLLHLADTFTTGPDAPISAATMTTALDIGEYLIAHALATFDEMGADPRLTAARRIGRWITAGRHATFTRREAYRALRGQAQFSTVEPLIAGLSALDELGWVRGLASERGPGRPPTRYESNPALFGEAWTERSEVDASTEQDDVLSIPSMDSGRFGTTADEADAARDAEPWVTRPVAPAEPPGMGDWFALPASEPNEAASDEWGTIG